MNIDQHQILYEPWKSLVSKSENVDGVSGSQAVMSSWARGERLAMTTHPMLPYTQLRFTWLLVKYAIQTAHLPGMSRYGYISK